MVSRTVTPAPVPRDESVEEWLERTIARHGPMPEWKAEKLRRIINADPSRRSA